jgi:hypothetical protein
MNSTAATKSNGHDVCFYSTEDPILQKINVLIIFTSICYFYNHIHAQNSKDFETVTKRKQKK